MKGKMFRNGTEYLIEETFREEDGVIKDRNIKILEELGKKERSIDERLDDIESAVSKLTDLILSLIKKRKV